MLQRIQSVYLFLVFIFALLTLLLPLGNFETNGFLFVVKSWGVVGETALLNGLKPLWSGYFLLLLLLVIMCLSVYTTFSYKARRKQIRLGKMNIMLHLVLIVVAFFYLDQLKAMTDMDFSYGIAIIFPLLSMVLILMANRAIKRDEDMVRSADRLR